MLFPSKALVPLSCLTGKDDSRPQQMTTECAAYVQAAQVLDSVVTSIVSGEVNVECIETISRNHKNFEALIRCYYGQPNSRAGIDCDDVLQRTEKLASDIAQFKDTRLKLQFLCERCSCILPARGRGRGKSESVQTCIVFAWTTF